MNSPQNVKVNFNCRHAWYASWRMGALIPLLAVYAVSAVAFALDPPPTGGYPNEVTALGEDALFSQSTGGLEATASGYQALYNNTTGSQNTAVGAFSLYSNSTGGS